MRLLIPNFWNRQRRFVLPKLELRFQAGHRREILAKGCAFNPWCNSHSVGSHRLHQATPPRWPNRDRAYFEHDGFASVFNGDIHNNRSYNRFGHFDERDGRPGGRERQCDDLNDRRQPWHEMRDNRNEPREYRCGEDGFYLFREDGMCYDDEGFCYSFGEDGFYYDVEEGRRYDSGGFACDEYGVRFDYADGPQEDNGGNLDARPLDPGSPRVVRARKTPPRKRVSIVDPVDAEPEDRRRPWRPRPSTSPRAEDEVVDLGEETKPTSHLESLTLYRPPQNRWSDSIQCSIEISLSGPKTTHLKKIRNIRFFPALPRFGHRCPDRNVPSVGHGLYKETLFSTRDV
ncbi:hypothetical protein DAPPUDRAFT_115266 [Daphnia pulex]|uniref:Uncharacterized protein n=1 Tax=Daphnia pulex TaxID=6669 RepID=E9HKU4_DAPPU|nr:hypothetical protein DAPPUDRAFT_115266 [Daphnia pulex]|eukprot:EFX67630.1 hypothetical protein DAPPUDRAFT_115266 [Daphnia pulex]